MRHLRAVLEIEHQKQTQEVKMELEKKYMARIEAMQAEKAEAVASLETELKDGR